MRSLAGGLCLVFTLAMAVAQDAPKQSGDSPHSGNAEPDGGSRKQRNRTGRGGPDPVRVAQFAGLTFLVGVAFLLVGYALS